MGVAVFLAVEHLAHFVDDALILKTCATEYFLLQPEMMPDRRSARKNLEFLALAKGAYLFVGPPEQVKSFTNWWLNGASDETMRFFALISFIIGSAVLAFIL